MRTVSGPSERSGARRSGHPSSVFHEDRERADRSPRGSTPGNNSELSANLRKYLLQPKARSKSTTLRQEKRVTDSLTLHSIDKSIKHRVGATPNRCACSAHTNLYLFFLHYAFLLSDRTKSSGTNPRW